MKKFKVLFVVLIIASFAVVPAGAVSVDSASNRFIFDKSAVFEGNIQGDLVVLGGDSSVKGSAAGDVLTAGKAVFTQISNASGNVICMGDTVSISAEKAKNIYAAGNFVKVNSASNAGGVYIAGRDITFSGSAKELMAAGQYINIDGSVSDKLVLRSENININPNAKINGQVIIYSSKEPQLPASVNKQNVKFYKIEASQSGNNAAEAAGAMFFVMKLLGILTAILIAIIFTALNSGYFKKKALVFKKTCWRYVLYGLITLIVVPIASIIIMFFVITIPISIIILMLYGIALFVAPVYTGVVLGRLFLKKINRYWAAIAGAAAVNIILMIPYLGALAYLFCALYTLGAVVTGIRLGKKETEDLNEAVSSDDKKPQETIKILQENVEDSTQTMNNNTEDKRYENEITRKDKE